MQSSKPFGIGIIGAGQILNRQAGAYLAVPALARMVGVADLDGDRAEAARKRYGMALGTSDYRRLLDRDDVDIVSVCTRPDTHARFVREALQAGKHVLCEKPVTRTLAEADELIALCKTRPEQQVSVLYQWRADAAVRFLGSLIESGTLGRPLMADVRLRTWRPDAYYTGGVPRETWGIDGGGVLAVIAIHQIDALIHVLGDPVEVSAQLDHYLKPSEGEDAIAGWIRFASGAIATLRCAVFDHRDRFEIEVLGERAALRLLGDGPACRWEVESRQKGVEREIRQLGRAQAPAPSRLQPSLPMVRQIERFYRLRGKPWVPPATWWHTPYITRFLEALRDGAPVPVSPLEARRSLELTVALYQSALTDSVVRLPLGPESPCYAGVDPESITKAQGDAA